MSLDLATLKSGIKSAFVSAGGDPDRSDPLAAALAAAIDAYIRAAVVVPVAMVSAAPGSPVTGVGALT